MDKTNRKTNKEIVVNPDSSETSAEKKEKTQLAGLDDKFPIENFIKLTSVQKGKKIHLQTYKYKANIDTPKGVVYLLYVILLIVKL
jgi:hypothetical protein